MGRKTHRCEKCKIIYDKNYHKEYMRNKRNSTYPNQKNSPQNVDYDFQKITK